MAENCIFSMNSKGRITYEARKPQDIKFAPLNKDTEYTADQLMELYEVSIPKIFRLQL